MQEIAKRLMRYVQIDTQSDPESDNFPSTAKQKDLSKLLVEELLAMGVEDAELDPWGYVYATIPSNTTAQVPVICLCAHVDTAPDCSGKGVKPIFHSDYQGQDIVLPDDPAQVISPREHPYLLQKIGDDIITASGLTLLGADDKAGVAIIMELAKTLMENQNIQHGAVRILFTPDEEVGRGVEHLDMHKLGAQFGYTLDGGELGSLETETFSANGVEIQIHGVIAHPGSAKGLLVNAIKLAAEFIAALPSAEWAPEHTEGKQGFVHPTDLRGTAESALIKFIVRDFDTDMLALHEARLEAILREVLAKEPRASYTFTVREQYRNMREVLDKHPQVVEHAAKAMKACGIEPINLPVRGGTDGSRLSFMGLPCPNIFTGEMALHSRHEFVSVQDMEKSVKVLIELLKSWELAVSAQL
ncbi:MAG: peptidase [Bacteroidota bacterium]|jgi:tripeptide aminopeptidase